MLSSGKGRCQNHLALTALERADYSTRWLWMRTRIVHGQPFGRGGIIEGLVGGDQRHRSETSILLLLVDFEGGGELHGVIGASACVFASRMASLNRAGVISIR